MKYLLLTQDIMSGKEKLSSKREMLIADGQISKQDLLELQL